MWSQLQLCLLVGFAFASNTPAFKENTEYSYNVRIRTLNSLHDLSNEYLGILIKAKLTILSGAGGLLQAKITNAQYAELHTDLKDWEQQIPDSQLSYKQLELSEEPFEIAMQNGIVRNLIVSQQIKNWELNLIKAIVSQFQMDTNGANLINSDINTRPLNDENSAIYKTIEDTVTGITETLYDIHPLSAHILQSEPWLAPLRELRGDGQFIEIVKTKNHSRSMDDLFYHQGFENMRYSFEPLSNQIGDFFYRSTLNRAVVTGNLKRYTIQSSVTHDEIIVSPLFANHQKGSVRTCMNITLLAVKKQNGKYEVKNPVTIENLVYSDDELSADNKVNFEGQQYSLNMNALRHPKRFPPSMYHEAQEYQQDELSADTKLIFEEQEYSMNHKPLRYPKRFPPSMYHDAQEYQQDERKNHQRLSELHQAPLLPLLPYTVGYHGLPLKNVKNIADMVEMFCKQISEQLKHPNEILEKSMLSQFVRLVSIIRTMNVQEMQEVADRLYTEQQGEQHKVWQIYRDAVAQAGFGPSLVCIQNWIETEKISEYEAGQLVFVLSRATRLPTEEYMRAFFRMLKDPKIMQQVYLNESVVYSFAHLCRKVYADHKISHDNYPVHAYEHFNTKSGNEFLENEVIPYLGKQLDQAILEDRKQDIHSYLYALRNIGHVKILTVFEPYLEGKKQASQVQRALMILASGYLVKTNPSVAQNVFYRIYQNPAENDLVRCLAVYQLVHTHPSASLLQRMADYTNIDTSEQVNAAVQTIIQNAATLEGEEYQHLRFAAKSALPYLSKKQYGVQDFKKLLLQFVHDELDETYTHSALTFGGKDHFLPNGLYYTVNGQKSGVGRHYLTVLGLVSSIDDLFTVWRQQTKDYLKNQEQQQQQNQPWSSKRIAELLGVKLDRNEQLEGIITMYAPLLLLENNFSFDNHSIENLPEIIKHFEEELRNGKEFHYSKLMNNQEYTIALPTACGFPFIFTYDNPLVFKFDGKFQALATPAVSSNRLLNRPEKLEGELTIRALVSGKVQSRFGFLTPFNARHYSIGYDKNVHIDLPLKIDFQVDTKGKLLKLQLEALEQAKQPDFRCIHFSTWPYTLKEDMLSMSERRQPIISVKKQQEFSTTVGLEGTGIALKLEGKADEMPNLKELLLKMNTGADSFYEYVNYWTNDKIQFSEYTVKVDSDRSLTSKINLEFSYDYRHKSQVEGDYYSREDDAQTFKDLPDNARERREYFFKRASVNIENADTYVYDAVVEFSGDNLIKYVATGALSKSNVDSNSKFLFELMKKNRYNNKPYYIKVSARSHIPNTNGLDMDYAIEFDPTSNAHIHVALGENSETATKLKFDLKGTKSEERKQYLRQIPMYHECKKQERQGNYQLPICANMTVQANFLDHLKIKLGYQDVDNMLLNQTYKLYSFGRYFLYPYVDENILAPVLNKDEVEFDLRFSPCFTKLTALMQVYDSGLKTLFNDVEINDFFRHLLVPHPVFHVKSRLTGKLFGYDIYRPYCVVDKTAVSTFEQVVYPATFSNDWTLMLLYVPTWASEKYRDISQQFEKQIEHYAVLTKTSTDDMYKKEVKITVQTPETHGKYVEILLRPSTSTDHFDVFVNGAEVKISQKQSTDLYDGYLQIYALPHNEIKVELSNDFYVLYDGTRARLSVLNGKFRGSVRGICGAFEEKATALQNPEGCILSDPQEFIESYTVMQKRQYRPLFGSKSKHSQCYQKEQHYVDVITENDVNRQVEPNEQRDFMCTKHQTQYVQNGNEVCFTLRPVPVCKTGCGAEQFISKKIPVHCVKDKQIVGVWKKQIEKGGSPNFSHKTESKQITMDLPLHCSN